MSNVSMIDGHIDEHKLSDEQIITLVNKNAKYSSQYKMIADLIQRKDEQIKGLIAGQETLQKHLAEKNAEIERLQKERIERIRELTRVVYDKEIAEAKSEAIKEFAERLKEKTSIKSSGYMLITEMTLNNLVKEMVGTKADTSVSLIDGHIENDFDSKAFWEDTH